MVSLRFCALLKRPLSFSREARRLLSITRRLRSFLEPVCLTCSTAGSRGLAEMRVPFGREFDSLADVVSFGIAPALLVYQIVLRDFHRTGWLIAFVYLLCGTLRLARFNCYANAKNGKPAEDFVGFPIPAAAGLIASLTLFMLWLEEGAKEIGAVEIRAGCLDAFPFFHDVQPGPLSKLQRSRLADSTIHSALSADHRRPRFQRDVLRVDARIALRRHSCSMAS